jgi:hypothetical protein
MPFTLNRALALTSVVLGLFAAVRAQTAATQLHRPVSAREDQFQNDTVHVWKTTVLPHQPLAMHHHDHPRVIVALSDGSMDLVDSTGTHDLHVWQKDHAYWLPAMPKGAMHADVNPGDKPIDVMVVELEKER